MSKLIIILILVMGTFIKCTTAEDVRSWNDEQIEQWYDTSSWGEWAIEPHEGFDKRAFVEQNILNPSAWAAALYFLKNTDMNSCPVGRIELPNSDAFVTVTDYFTKDSAQFEAHKKYIDIQYVSRGAEYIYITPMENMCEYSKEYDSEADIEFFNTNKYTKVLADSTNIVVLFPSDGHKPCIKIASNDPVRKIVVKIPVIQ